MQSTTEICCCVMTEDATVKRYILDVCKVSLVLNSLKRVVTVPERKGKE